MHLGTDNELGVLLVGEIAELDLNSEGDAVSNPKRTFRNGFENGILARFNHGLRN
jgi:hypothetical protein